MTELQAHDLSTELWREYDFLNKFRVAIVNAINSAADLDSDCPKVSIEIKDFDTPIETCIERDSKRAIPVTGDEIRKIQQRFLFAGFPDVSPYLTRLNQQG